MSKSRLLGLVIIAVSMTVGTANAGNVVKRIKCAEANGLPPFLGEIRHWNRSGFTKYMNFQVVRDGCRPRAGGGTYRLQVRMNNNTVISDFFFDSIGNRTNSTRVSDGYSVAVPDNHYATLIFFNYTPNGKSSGTYDYVYSFD